MAETPPPSMTDLLTAATQDTLTFNPALAKNAMDICSGMIGYLLAIGEQLDRTKENTKDFAGPLDPFASGHKWAAGFGQLADQANGILDANVKTVQAMADLFREAAKTFQNAEDESVRAFTSLKMTTQASPDVSMTQNDYAVIFQKYQPRPAGDVEQYRQMVKDPGAVGNYSMPKDDKALSPENSTALTWGQLVALRNSINSDNVSRLAAEWGWMKGRLDFALDTFKRDIVDNTLMTNGWVGVSASAAAATASNYVTEAKKFAAKMGKIEESLYKAASYLQATKNEMPRTDQPPLIEKNGDNYYFTEDDRGNPSYGSTEQECLEGLLKLYRIAFDATYVQGVFDYNANLISFDVFPTSGLPTPEVPSNPQNDDPGSPTSPGTTTPSSPTTTQPTTPQPNEEQPANPNPTQPTTTDDSLKNVAELASTVLSSGTEALQTVMQEGVTGLQSLISSGTTALQQLTQQETTQDPTTPGLTTTTTTTGNPSGLTTGGGSPSGLGSGSPTTTTSPQKTQLFPRAAVPVSTASEETTTTTTSRAGLATTSGTTTGASSPMMGSPMSGASQGQQGKEHKRAEYLKSGTNLNEVFEELPVAVTPVAEK
ncbi:hypothetical protein [Nocardia sp. NPDC127526]|uniref:hypothetical protein n=1 Tax=Nocardia sp. NPDC127526 TaxID=3345393 RepID=UPI00363EB101